MGHELSSKSWRLRHERRYGCFEINQFVALFPEYDGPHGLGGCAVPDYVKISHEEEEAYFKCGIRDGAEGREIWVSLSALRDVPNQAEIEFEAVSATRYHWYLLLNKSSQRWAFFGLLLATIGIIIDGILAVESGLDSWEFSSTAVTILMVAAFVFKILGLIVVFWKGVIEHKIRIVS